MKKNLLTMVILALVLVNIALSVVMMISVTSTNSKTAALVTTIATVMNLELTDGSAESAVSSISIADTEVYTIPNSMTVALKTELDESGNPGKQVYMVFDISLQINKKHDDYATLQPLVAGSESLIKDAINTVVASKTESECRGNQDALKAEILKRVQELFGSDFIYGVAISEVKFG